PTHAEALLSLARLVGSRYEEEAIGLLSRWSERKPADIAPWIVLARLYVTAQKPQLAETAFRRGLEQSAGNVDALTGLGRVLSSGRKHDDALEIWSRLAALQPQSFEPKLQIARIHHVRRDSKAEKYLREILQVEPDHREALQYFAQLLERDEERLDQALDVL